MIPPMATRTDIFEGDIVITEEQYEEYYGGDSSHDSSNQNEQSADHVSK